MHKKTQEEIFALSDKVRETAFALHCYLRQGHLEKIYENGMINRLTKQGITVEQQHPIEVRDEDGTVLGDLIADLLAEDDLLIELKAVKTIANEHIAQILGYLRATGKEHGLLINFGAPKLQVRKFILSQAFEPTNQTDA